MRFARVAFALVSLAFFGSICSQSAAADRNLRVTVNYQGAGAVDKSHRLFVLVFTTSYIGHEGVRPIACQALSGNGETATLGISVSPVYLEVFYDRKGACPESCDEPPSGSPAALYGAQPGQADPVEAPESGQTEVSIAFDDSMTVP